MNKTATLSFQRTIELRSRRLRRQSVLWKRTQGRRQRMTTTHQPCQEMRGEWNIADKAHQQGKGKEICRQGMSSNKSKIVELTASAHCIMRVDSATGPMTTDGIWQNTCCNNIFARYKHHQRKMRTKAL